MSDRRSFLGQLFGGALAGSVAFIPAPKEQKPECSVCGDTGWKVQTIRTAPPTWFSPGDVVERFQLDTYQSEPCPRGCPRKPLA